MKYSWVQQHGEADCGAACLATVAKHYGRTFALSRIREAVGTGQLGTTLLGLRRGAETLGFDAQPVKASTAVIDRLDEAPLPAIIHWKGYHWVVLYGRRGQRYVVADPGVGVRYLSRQELTEAWSNGIMLLLTPVESRFYDQPSDQPSDRPRGFRQLWRRLWIDRGVLGEAILLNLVVGLLALAVPLIIQVLTDQVLVQEDADLLATVALGAMTLIGFSSLLRLIQGNLIAHFAQRLELRLVLDFGRQLLRLPMIYYESHRSGEIVSRLRDIREVNFLVSQVVISLPSEFFIALVSVGLMLAYSWPLTVVALAVAALMSAPTLLFFPILQRKTRDLLVADADNQGVLIENFKGALTLKTSHGASQAWDELQNRFGQLANITLRTVQMTLVNSVISGLIAGIGAIAILWFGGWLVIQQQLSIGQLLAFNALYRYVTSFVESVIRYVDELARAKTALERLSDILEASPETPETNPKPWVEIADNAAIVCTDVSFHHAGRVELLQNFSLTIPGGQFTALAGQSGCGKSTLAKLIAGIYPLTSGNIRFGSYNQSDIPLDCLRQHVVLVPQEPHFWSRSILENFRLSCPYASFEAIIAACEMTGADAFISQLPDKYQTVLGEFGINLSGGQRQRLAIARALVTNPPILLLDESTAALDPVSEAEILERLISHRQGKTTLIISHRPQVLRRADWMVFLDGGRLKQAGCPADLANQPGAHVTFLE